MAPSQCCPPRPAGLLLRCCRLKGSPLKMEYGPLPRDKASLDELLPLYKQTGEKNGFCVLGEQEFYEFHTNTPDLTLLTIRVRRGAGAAGAGGGQRPSCSALCCCRSAAHACCERRCSVRRPSSS